LISACGRVDVPWRARQPSDMSVSMMVTLKLYASLGAFLPQHAERNQAAVEIEEGATIRELLDRYNVPPQSCHLVLLNGIFQAPAVRTSTALKPGDTVAVWPPVAGG
jgi:molybdopterin converting factor small subunit